MRLTDVFGRIVGVVTTERLATIHVILVVTACLAVGIGGLDTSEQASASPGAFDHLAPVDGARYATTHYPTDESAVRPTFVYVRTRDGNVLSRESLLDSVRYQQQVTRDATVGAALLADGGSGGVANLIAKRLAGDRDADLQTQIAALEAADNETVAAVVTSTLTEGSPALALLPQSYDPGTATVESHRLAFRFRSADAAGDARNVLYETARARETPSYFTVGEQAQERAQETRYSNLVTLVLPVALLSILLVLAVTYRDVVDVLVGMTGVVVSVVWMFGILGWLGVDAGLVAIVGPVLMIGLSVDFSFHVFMRYREHRGSGDSIVRPMRRSIRAIVPAFGLVTLTTAIGFLSNLTSPLASIRGLGIGITLGVCSALVLFLTFVPALKITIDTGLERLGIDRTTQPLGQSARLGRLFDASLLATRRAAGLVLLVALVVGICGILAFGALDQKSYRAESAGSTTWQQSLPGPLAWDVPEFEANEQYVEEQYGTTTDRDSTEAELLVDGRVTSDDIFYRLQGLTDEARERGLLARAGPSGAVRSPLSLLRSVATESASVRQAIDRTDTDGDDIPDRNVADVYDAVYAAAPDRAPRVIERRDGEYRSLRVVVRSDPSLSVDDRAAASSAVATTAEAGPGAVTVTPVGSASVRRAVVSVIAEHIFTTLLVALGALTVVVTITYRLINDSATLGVVTTLPVVLVAALVFLGMFLLSIPITLVTALLLSLVLGLGIDYSIHVSDRFRRELDAGARRFEALRTTLEGTGGALLGTTLTSVGAFAALLLVPVPAFQSLGLMVCLAMSGSFLATIVVLPSLLSLWSAHVYEDGPGDESAAPSTGESATTSTTLLCPVRSADITVRELEPAIDFYVDRLGLDLRRRAETIAVLSGPAGRHQLTLWEADRPAFRTGAPDQHGHDRPQVAFELATGVSARLLYNRLAMAEIVVRADDAAPGTALCFEDPDGNSVRVCLDGTPPVSPGSKPDTRVETTSDRADHSVDHHEPTDSADPPSPAVLRQIVDGPRPTTRRQIVAVLAHEYDLSEAAARRVIDRGRADGIVEVDDESADILVVPPRPESPA
jgi:predicted RND superfamily exporter protein/catechol 2,3-dioxygenase-like lactoylglutathione lyase family enzyme